MGDDWQDMVKDNTLPLALIGVGLGWLLLSNAKDTETFDQARSWADRQGASARGRYAQYRGQARGAYAEHRGTMSRYYDQARGRVTRAMDSVRHGADELRNRAGEGMRGQSGHDTDRGYDSVADYDARGAYAAYGADDDGYDYRTSGARQGSGQGMMGGLTSRTRHAGESLWDMIDEHPLAAGLMGLALGAAVGASLPATQTEDEWFGEYRDQLAERAWHEGEGYVDKASTIAKEAARAGTEAARDKAREEADRQGLTAGETTGGEKSGGEKRA